MCRIRDDNSNNNTAKPMMISVCINSTSGCDDLIEFSAEVTSQTDTIHYTSLNNLLRTDYN